MESCSNRFNAIDWRSLMEAESFRREALHLSARARLFDSQKDRESFLERISVSFNRHVIIK